MSTPGTGEEGPCQRQTLPLAPGQGLAALAHEGVVAVLEGLNVLIDAGGPAGPEDLGVTGRRRRQANIVGDGGPHEMDPLIHHPDLLVEAERAQIGHVLAVDEDTARRRLIERTASWASVDLPEPEAPTMQVHLPALARRLTPRTA